MKTDLVLPCPTPRGSPTAVASPQEAGRPCPVCGSPGGVPAGPRGDGFVSEAGGRAFEHPSYQVLCCPECGHYYKSAIPTEDQLTEYYQTVNHRQWDADELFPTESRLLRELADLPEGSRVLDFGCGSGRILGTVTDRFRCFGFEINPVSAAAAAGRGLRMLTEGELYDPAGEGFDAVLLIDVFEHLVSPASLLRRLGARLRPGGRLVLVTGNADAPACRKDPANFWYFRLYGHLLMLSRAGGRYWERALGLRLRSWVEMSHYEPPPWGSRARVALQDWAYDAFHLGGRSLARRLLRRVPVLRRAEHWPYRPIRNYTADHAIAVYENVSSPVTSG